MNRKIFVCLAALSIATITAFSVEDSKETENIECKQDGFLPHPTNCRAYYWCSLRRRVRAIILECENDEIFDTKSEKCTYPNLSTRKECGGTKHLAIEFETNGNTARNFRALAQSRNSPNGCNEDGFMGDENDCSKFYRCVNNGGGQFAKYDFSCAPGTVWDSDISSCNHPWAVKSKCGHGLISSSPQQSHYPQNGEYNQYPVGEQPYPINQPNPYPSYPYPNPIYQQQQPQGVQNPEYQGYPISHQPQEGYNPDTQQPQNENKPNPEQPYKETNPMERPSGPNQNQEGSDNPNPIYQSSQGGYYPSNEYNPPQHQEKPPSTYSPPLNPKPQQPSSSESNEQSSNASTVIDNEINSDSTECQIEGFLTDPKDCRKFYRCIENGKKSFTKYEFSCGQGTVWDSEINACNHLWAVRKDNCKYKIEQENTSGNQFGNETNGQTNETETGYETGDKEPIGENASSNLNNLLPSSQYGTSSSESPQNGLTSTSEAKQESSTENFLSTTENNSSPSSGYTDSTSSENISSNTNTSLETGDEKGQQEISYECKKEGFIPDKRDCKKFYRCVQNNNGGYIKYEFTCGEGTVWDSDENTCNFPWATGNQCGNGTESTFSESSSTNLTTSIETEINSSTEKGSNQIDTSTSEQNNSTSPSQVPSESSENNSSTNITSTTENIPVSTNSTFGASLTGEGKPQNNECTDEDFIPDKNDCKKFYRCVKSNKKGFIKYEFICGEGTVWDPDAKTCNYAWATRGKCETGKETGSIDSGSSTTINSSLSLENTPNNFISGESMGGNATSSTGSVNSSSQHINSSTSDEKYSSSSEQVSNTSSESSNKEKYDKCTDDGFIGDSKKCKKFYRCVDNGKGGFTKYEFTCAEGTVWDNEYSSCNYPWAVNRNCQDVETTDSQENNETTNGISSSDKDTKPDENNENSTISSISDNNSTASGSSNEIDSTIVVPQEKNDCKQDGFVGDLSDCKKFYRCVDNGKGSYIKYEFTCGEGTVWDSKLDTCNYPWAAQSMCGNKDGSLEETLSSESPAVTQNSTVTEETSSEKLPENGSQINSTVEIANPETINTNEIDKSTIKPDEATTKKTSEQPVITTVTQIFSTDSDNRETQTETFNGLTTLTVNSTEQSLAIEITTVSSSEQTISSVSEQTSSHTSVQPVESTSEQTVGINNTSQTNEQLNSTDKYPSQTNETSPINQENVTLENMNKCTEEGFFPNLNHCNKFYRCVSNGIGGYTKYDFDCGGGTIWDPDLDTCNHPYAVTNKKCKQGSQQQQSKDECTEAGYFASSQDCKKFHRCVNNGKGQLTKYDFKCSNDTIWDPNTLSCNYPWATENKICGHRGENIFSTSTPDQETKTEPPREMSPITTTTPTTETTTLVTETTTLTTETATLTSETTTITIDQTTEQEIGITTSNQQTTTDIQVLSTESIPGTTETETEGQQTTKSQNEVTEISSQPSDQTTTTETFTTPTVDLTTENPKTETSLMTTTESIEKTTIEKEITTSGPLMTITDIGITETLGRETTTLHIGTETIESTDSLSSTTVSSLTDSPSIDSSSTDSSISDLPTSTTDFSSESTETVTTIPQVVNQNATCPISHLEGDQIALVCPTGFKRHPKYCNLFYQCTSNPETFEINILVISCPGRRIYDDAKIQCLPPDKSDQECTGQIAEKEQIRKFRNSISPMQIESDEPLCPNEGNFPLNPTQCDNNFIKCEKSDSRLMRGFMYQCPENMIYWSVSKKCERLSPALPCDQNLQQGKIWQIPVHVEKSPSRSMIDVRVKE